MRRAAHGDGALTMATALGEFVVVVARRDAAAVDGTQRLVERWPSPATPTIARPAPGILVAHDGDACVVVEGQRGGVALVHEPEAGGAAPEPATAAGQVLRDLLAGKPATGPLRARHAVVLWDGERRGVRAFTDAFRTYPVYYHAGPERIVCASDLRLVLAALAAAPAVDPGALYHYLNFGYIPSPHCAIAGVGKLEPGHALEIGPGGVARTPLRPMAYPEDLDSRDEAGLVRELRDRIVANVRDYLPGPGASWGTFLSGGTDSSSIAGILAGARTGPPVDSFSIGFAESGFDEMSYSRLAAGRFGLRSHERVVGEADSLAAIPRLAAAFDEPFGNPSAIPTFYCADLARQAGKSLLVAGDGGDEIFGGNERYAKDQILGWYYRAAAPVHAAGALAAAALKPFDFHLGNRVRNMIRRGRMPNPDRFYSDDSFASDHFDELLTPGLRERIDRDASLQLQRDAFAGPERAGELHRLMYLDLRMTIAESDLVKVLRASRLAGIDVAFPYIDRQLVDYTGRLPQRYKVNGLEKRYLFKKAMADILPEEIRKKKKQGFGLPLSVWLRRGGPIRDLARDVVLSPRAMGRGYFEPAFVERLFERHERGSWDHSAELFRLTMLELWHRAHVDHD
jgi:asparagine synthase (glutamine-hydrolysing)